MYSTESAIRSRLGSEYSMPPWPMAMPSSTAMVLNSFATPPAASISRATIWPRSFRCTCPGTNCVKLLTTATIGLPKSPSFMPVARHRARAPAMLRPWVEVRERYCGMMRIPVVKLRTRILNHGAVFTHTSQNHLRPHRLLFRSRCGEAVRYDHVQREHVGIGLIEQPC